jgi:DNA-binding NarL/FixJ family response regulator
VKVFIADDSAVLRKHLIDVLSGFERIVIAGEAENSGQAIDSIHRLKPDVVILDVRMPGGGGIEVLQKIKNEKASPIVIVFTNYPYPQYRKKFMEAGAEFFFDKSTESEKMIEVLQRLNDKLSGSGSENTEKEKRAARRK